MKFNKTITAKSCALRINYYQTPYYSVSNPSQFTIVVKEVLCECYISHIIIMRKPMQAWCGYPGSLHALWCVF